jgi:hypothetical protein
MKRIFYLIVFTLFLNNINAQQMYDVRISEKQFHPSFTIMGIFFTLTFIHGIRSEIFITG